MLIVTERRYIFKGSKSQELQNVGTALQTAAVMGWKHIPSLSTTACEVMSEDSIDTVSTKAVGTGSEELP